MNSKSTASDGLSRRQLLASAAAAGVAAGGGGFSAAAAWTGSMTPAAAVHLDVPFIDTRGAHRPYRPPMRLTSEAGAVDPHELA
jgi:hypothetical protein